MQCNVHLSIHGYGWGLFLVFGVCCVAVLSINRTQQNSVDLFENAFCRSFEYMNEKLNPMVADDGSCGDYYNQI